MIETSSRAEKQSTGLFFAAAPPPFSSPATKYDNKGGEAPERAPPHPWSGLRDLNPRSLGPKPSAIPNFAKPGYSIFTVVVKHVVKEPCSREFARGKGAKTIGFARGFGLSDFSRTWGVLHAPKPSAIPNFAKPGWIRFWRRGFGRCGESTGYYIRFAWKMQPPFFGRHGCFTDGAVVFFGRQGCFFQRGEAFAPKSFPLRGRCRRRRRKRCRIGLQFLSMDAKTGRKSPLPSSGLRGGTPYASLPARGGILRAACSDGRKNGTSSAPKSFPLRGRCRRRRRKRCRTKKHSVPSDAKTERMTPLPSSGLRGTPDATLPSRGGIFARQSVPASCGPCCCPCAISSWRRRPRSRSRRGG